MLLCPTELYRIDYMQTISSSVETSILSKGLTICKQQVHMLQHPSCQKGWLCANNKSISCSIHLVKRGWCPRVFTCSYKSLCRTSIWTRRCVHMQLQVPLQKHPSEPHHVHMQSISPTVEASIWTLLSLASPSVFVSDKTIQSYREIYMHSILIRGNEAFYVISM